LHPVTRTLDDHGDRPAPARVDGGGPASRRYLPVAAVTVAAFGAFLAFMDSTVVNVAFPNLEASFPHTSVGDLSWILNAYNIVFAGLLVLAGRFADLLGRRRLFKMGLVVFTVTSGLCALSTSIDMLIVFRVIQGAGAAMLVPASLGVVVHASPIEHRSHSLSLWAAAGALAAGLGPPIGGGLVDLYNWRLVFVINVPLGIIAWLLVRRVVIESRAPGRRLMPDLRGALVLSAALAAVTLGIVQGSSWGWASPATVVTFVIAAACAVLAVQSSRHHRSPILDPALLAVRGFTVSNLIAILAGLGLYTYLLTNILWLYYIWGYSLLLAGLAVAPGAAVAAITAGPFGKLADRFGPRVVVVPGAVVWASAYVWYATRVGLHPDFLGQWLPGQVISGIGVGATLPVATSGGLATVPAGRYATAAAVNSSARQLGGVLGIAILTIFIAHPIAGLPGDLRHGWELAAGSFAAAAVVALFFGRIHAATESGDTASLAPLVSRSPEPSLVSVDTSPTEAGLLGLLPSAVRDEILAMGETVRLRAGEVLFQVGDPGDALFLVQSGRLEVQHPGGSAPDLSAGSVVGELALLTDAPRLATVVARRDSTLVAISREGFEHLAHAQPVVISAVAKGVAHLLQASRPIGPSGPPIPKVIALVALDAGVPIEALAGALHTNLAGAGQRGPGLAGTARPLRVVRLDGGSPEALERAEQQSDRVLLVAGPAGTWHDACLRQADRVVAATSSPEPRLVAGLRHQADVVVTGPAPLSTQVVAWHDACGCRSVSHLGDDPGVWDARLHPLVARLAGRSIALVLAGGGARALAHIGVLHAFENAGIEIDRVAGTSMGALIGALYATGLSAGEVETRVFEEFVQRSPFSDYRPSFTSLARGERGKAMLQRCFGDSYLETMERELVVVSTDLYEKTAVYHRRGRTAEVVGASICLPVLFPPQLLNGRVLVDGALSDNCPITAFTKVAEGPVVAVRIGNASSGSHSERVPSLGETLIRVMQMGDRRVSDDAAANMATITVTPDTRGVGLLEFHQINAARDAGLRAGEAAVVALQEGGWVLPPAADGGVWDAGSPLDATEPI
jgi:EmrB/QacA subfamily drug resistance transporter